MSTEFLPLTLTECVRELSKFTPGSAPFPFIQAGARVTWMRGDNDEEEHWREEFTVWIGREMQVSGSKINEVFLLARDYLWKRYGQ